MIYVVNFLSVLLYYLIFNPKENKNGRILYCSLICIQLTVISGIRYNVGDDFQTYVRIYYKIKELKVNEWLDYIYFKEILFFLYTKIMSLLFQNHTVFYFIGLSFITNFFLIKTIYKRNIGYFWGIYMYLSMNIYYISMNQIRQILAVCIVLYSIQYIEEKKFKSYFTWIAVAAGFHNSALIMLPLYFVNKIKITNKKQCIKLLICVICTGYFLKDFIIYIVSNYTKYGHLLLLNIKVNNSLINFCFRIALLLFCLYGEGVFNYKKIDNRQNDYLLLKIVIIGMFFQFMTIYAPLLARINTYFYTIFILLTPEVMEKGEVKKLFKILFGVVMLIYHIYYFKHLTNMNYMTVFTRG